MAGLRRLPETCTAVDMLLQVVLEDPAVGATGMEEEKPRTENL